MDKADLAEALEEIGVLLELKGENPFKVRAYQNGARALQTLEKPLAELLETDRLREVPGIGEALAVKIATLHATGRLDLLEQLRAATPPGLREMLQIPGLGPKKIKALHQQLGIDTLAGLAEACQAGRVAELPGFGEKSQQKILDGIRHREAYARRHLWWDAHAVAEPILAGLRTLPEVVRAEHAGSLRRGLETVGDLDFLAASSTPGPIMDWFVSRPEVAEVTARGETKSSVRLADGLQADLRVVPPGQFAFALHHFTGSKDHNVKMRQRALARGWSLSEWGLSPKSAEGAAAVTPPAEGPPLDTEEDLFRFLGLHPIPPELREGLEEIEEAERGPLPRLVEWSDLRGALHNHTHASDGRNSLEEMARAAAALGWEYLGLADHSQASFQANGLSEARLLAQLAEIRRLNASGTLPVRLLAGVECDILPDGSLDVSTAVRAQLDYVVVSVHSAFSQSRDDLTRRITRALEQPHVHVLGHPTGRLLLRREGYAVDLDRVIDAALANGVAIELNANPQRLELDWRHWRRAAARGLRCLINPDAHSTDGLTYARAGLLAARKGWLTADHVLNTRPAEELLQTLRARNC